MLIFTPSDLLGLFILALFLLLALLMWVLILLGRLRAWLRRKWKSFTYPWSRAHA